MCGPDEAAAGVKGGRGAVAVLLLVMQWWRCRADRERARVVDGRLDEARRRRRRGSGDRRVLRRVRRAGRELPARTGLRRVLCARSCGARRAVGRARRGRGLHRVGRSCRRGVALATRGAGRVRVAVGGAGPGSGARAVRSCAGAGSRPAARCWREDRRGATAARRAHPGGGGRRGGGDARRSSAAPVRLVQWWHAVASSRRRGQSGSSR